METRPHPLVETFAGWLLPPACREHVLGDLYERNASTSQYVGDAVRTIPFAIWGQVRRTSFATLAAAEVGAVYVAFLGALGSIPGALDRSTPLGAAIPALAALVTVLLREAWVGRRARPRVSVAVDALLGIAGAAVSQTVLAGIGSPLALPANVVWLGSAIGLALLSGVRIALLPANQMETTNAGGNGMNPEPSNSRDRMQRDLRLWWWTIAVLGLSGWIGLFLFPGVSRFSPFLIAWLVAFVAIGIYQRRQTQWPALPPEGLTTPDRRRAYRVELERRRDQQYKWPARRPVFLIITVVGLAVLFDFARRFLPSAGNAQRVGVLMTPMLVAVLALTMYLFTHRLTNRAADAFQREIEALDSGGPDSRN